MDRQGGRAPKSRRDMGRGVHAREGRDHLGGELPPDIRQEDRAVDAVKEDDAELLFKQPHLVADRRWRDGKVVCCKREGAEARGGLKGLNCLDGQAPEHCTKQMSSVHR